MTQQPDQLRGIAADLRPMRRGQLLQRPVCLGCQRQQHPSPVVGVNGSHHEFHANQPIRQTHRGMVFDKKVTREVADRYRLLRSEATDGEDRLMVLRGQSRLSRRLLTEGKKIPQ